MSYLACVLLQTDQDNKDLAGALDGGQIHQAMVDEKVDDTKLFQIWSFYDETLFLRNISWTNVPWTIIIWTNVGLDIFFHLVPHWLQIIRKYFSTYLFIKLLVINHSSSKDLHLIRVLVKLILKFPDSMKFSCFFLVIIADIC